MLGYRFWTWVRVVVCCDWYKMEIDVEVEVST